MNKFMNTVDMLYMPLEPMLIKLNVYTSVCIARVYDALQSKSRKGSCEICTREMPGSEMSNGHCRASTQRGLFGCCKPCPIQGPWLANNTQSTVRWKRATCAVISSCSWDKNVTLAKMCSNMARTWAETSLKNECNKLQCKCIQWIVQLNSPEWRDWKNWPAKPKVAAFCATSRCSARKQYKSCPWPPVYEYDEKCSHTSVAK